MSARNQASEQLAATWADAATPEQTYDALKQYQAVEVIEYVLPTTPLGEQWVLGIDGHIVKLTQDQANAWLAGAAAVAQRLAAAVDLVRRTGAFEFALRYQDDEQPVVWVAVAGFHVDAAGRPRPKGSTVPTTVRHEAAGALDPLRAVLRLCEVLVDGGRCVHCNRPSGLEPDSLDTMPADQLICWYQWDPERETFRRACEGDL